MKKKCLYSLLTTYTLVGGTLFSSCKNDCEPLSIVPPPKKIVIYKQPELKFREDTIELDGENFDYYRYHGAGGVYFYSTNTVTVKHYRTKSNDAYIKSFCERNNYLKPLTLRHETEHALKRDLVHKTQCYSPVVRAEIAAMNETMAPATEIIEALDYRYLHEKPLPYQKVFVAHADSAIVGIMKEYNMSLPVDFSFTPIADTVIKYALESFTGAVGRGFYKYTIKKAAEQDSIPAKTVNWPAEFSFNAPYNPQIGKWGPLWTFSSENGTVDIYNSASVQVRQKLITTIDSIVCDVMNIGPGAFLLQKGFMY